MRVHPNAGGRCRKSPWMARAPLTDTRLASPRPSARRTDFALADKEVSSKLLAVGIEPLASPPDELKSFVISEIAKWAKIVRDAKIEPK